MSSSSLTCQLYLVDLFGTVTDAASYPASCDSTDVYCTLYDPSGDGFDFVCDSTLRFVDVGETEYFCVCGDNTLTVPEAVDCGKYCYDFSTPYTCNFLTLYNGYTSGAADAGVLYDDCSDLLCDDSVTPMMCLDESIGASYKCDDVEWVFPSSSTESYVCACPGPAKADEYDYVGKTCSDTKHKAIKRETPSGSATTGVATETESPTSMPTSQTSAAGTPSSIPSSNDTPMTTHARGSLFWLSFAVVSLLLLV